jgi:catechol 2,3-dioxygenase-like lactoylglutathione lyase family enzyme
MTQTLASITLLVREYEEAIAYYTQKLGFALVENTPLTDDKRWVRIALPGSSHVTLLLARASTPAQLARVGDQAGGRVFLFLQTNDFWQDHRAMRARGVRFVEEPRVEWYGTVAVFQDLYGNRWDLVQPTPQTPPRAS